MTLRIYCLALLGICVFRVASVAAPLPPDIAHAFAPPPGLENELGAYRSPLLFADGASVRTAEDWARRRDEIQSAWHTAMGEWPTLLEHPRIEYLEWQERDGFIQHKVRVQVAAEQDLGAYLLVPIGTSNAGAVLVPFYEPETSIGLGKPLRDFAYQLTRRGFVTLSIGSPGGDARKPELNEAPCQPLSYLAYVAANCATALSQLKEVDPQRIGVVGHSYGGKWAMFAACLSTRFACGVWSDPGVVFDEARSNVNYWDPWYLGAADGPPRRAGLPTSDNPARGAYQRLRSEHRDLHELQSLMAPRPFLVSGGSEDPAERWIALNHPRAVNRLLGYEVCVGMTNRTTHEPTTESNEVIYRFFEHFLRADAPKEGGSVTAGSP